jgi:cell division protein FtsI/penicillin-binding protein 2
VRIAHRIPPAQLDRAIRALGFGRVTGVELPAEARGLYRPPDRWSAVSRAGLAIGQEIAVSALQLAQAYGTIANDGRLVPPTLVLETVDERSGEVITPYTQRPAQQVLPAEVARAVAAMLQETIDDGTGTAARVAGYAVAGKTGTAQKAATRGGYAAGVHASWFAGFLPREDPRLVIVVCVDAPSTAFWASEVAAPVFGRIATRLVRLVGLPPRSGERA